MVNFDKRPLDHADGELRRHHRQCARAGSSVCPHHVCEHRWVLTWWVLLAAFAVLVTGIAIKQAPVVAIGVVLAAAGGSLYERRRQRARAHDRTPWR